MKNRIQTLPSADRLALVRSMLEGIEASPDGLGLPSGLVDALAQARAEGEAAGTAVVEARNGYHARVRDREAKDAALSDLAATVARMLYANPEVGAAALASTGLQPRATARRRVVPAAPTGLTLAVRPTGEIALRWTKNNPYGVIYRVESQTGSEPFAFVTDTTAGKVLLRGYPEGVQVAFLVRASRGGRVSEASGIAVAWHGTPALRAA